MQALSCHADRVTQIGGVHILYANDLHELSI